MLLLVVVHTGAVFLWVLCPWAHLSPSACRSKECYVLRVVAICGTDGWLSWKRDQIWVINWSPALL